MAEEQRSRLAPRTGTVGATRDPGDTQRVHGFATAGRAGQSTARLFLLNKMEVPQQIRVRLPAGSPAYATGQSVVDTDDHWGAVRATQVACGGRDCTARPTAILQATGTSTTGRPTSRPAYTTGKTNICHP